MNSSVMELKRKFGIKTAGIFLEDMGISKAEDFAGFTDEEILRLPHIGPETLKRIRAVVPYDPSQSPAATALPKESQDNPSVGKADSSLYTREPLKVKEAR